MKASTSQWSHLKVGKRILHVGLPLLVLAAGALIALGLIRSAPQAQRAQPVRLARLVEVQAVARQSERVRIQAMGTVKPARVVQLQPRVAGQIEALGSGFLPGGRLAAGELLARLDPADYQLTLRQRSNDVVQAASELALEMGRQRIAQRELELLGDASTDNDQGLVLRRPQLQKAEAILTSAMLAAEQASLQLDRTVLRAPFDATVLSRDVHVGMQVSAATPLGTLVWTGVYWVEALVPVDQLRWIRFPEGGAGASSRVLVRVEAALNDGGVREGRVLSLVGELEREGRMARILIEVPDPLALEPGHAGAPRLLLNAYVEVEIEGVLLEDVIRLDRRYLRNGREVWLMTAEDALEIRPVTIAFRGREQVLLSEGLRDAERVVMTDLPTPVAGMALRTAEGGPAGKVVGQQP